MKKLMPAIVLVFVMVLSAPLLAETQQGVPDKPQAAAGTDERFRKNLERWQKMTSEERAKLRERYARWVQMSPEQRQRVLENFRRFRSLPPEKQQALLRARWMMNQLQPKTHDALRQHMQHLQQLPPEQRQRILQRLKTVHELLKEDFEQVRQLPPNAPELQGLIRELRTKGIILGHLPAAELERLKDMTSEERHEAIGKLMEEWKSRPHPGPEGTDPRPEGPHRPDAFKRPGHDHRRPERTPESSGEETPTPGATAL